MQGFVKSYSLNRRDACGCDKSFQSGLKRELAECNIFDASCLVFSSSFLEYKHKEHKIPIKLNGLNFLIANINNDHTFEKYNQCIRYCQYALPV